MPEFAVTPDAVHTRERMRVATRTGQIVVDHHTNTGVGSGHDGIIDYDPHFLGEVYFPSTTENVLSLTDDANQFGAVLNSKRWFTVLDGGLYESTQRIATGASHVHDFDPRVLMGELELEILTEFAAAHPTATILSNAWDYTPGEPFGTYANRAIEVTSEQIVSESYTRGGTLKPGFGAPDFEVGVLAIPYEDADPLGDVPTFVGAPTPVDSWQSSALEFRTVDDGPLYKASDHAAEVGMTTAGTLTFGVSDGWWATNAWPITAGDGYPSFGLPLMTVPAIKGMWVAMGDPFGGDVHQISGRSVAIHFESDWQPPTYRITYETPSVPALVRQYPSDDARSWGATSTRIYPPTKTGRTIGGIT
jgi:hypothetical protein